MRNWLIGILLTLTAIGSALAQDVVELTYEGKAESASRTAARQEIFDKATEDVSMRYIRQIVGEKKTTANLELIKNKILKNSGKYILYMKGDDFKSSGNQSRMNVQMKVSLESLRTLLLREGLLYKMEGPPKVLPMITFTDRVNSNSFSWWKHDVSENRVFLAQKAKAFHEHLKTELRKNGFYGMEPVSPSLRKSIPHVFRIERPRTEDYMFLGQYFGSSILLRGDVNISKHHELTDTFKINIRLEALHSSNGRIIGEAIRSYSTETGSFMHVTNKKLSEVTEKVAHDLAGQLFEAWKRGTFGASLLKLTLNGEMDYKQLTVLKKHLLNQVNDIKGLRERLFTPDTYTYEVDSSSSATDLAEAIRRQKFPRFKVEVAKVSSDSLELSVKAW